MSYNTFYKINLIYKKCYPTCKICNEKGDELNNNCLECNNLFLFKDDFPNDTNCYQNCSDNYYYDNQGYHYCTENCPIEFNKYIKEKKRCIDECNKDNIYKYIQNVRKKLKISIIIIFVYI